MASAQRWTRSCRLAVLKSFLPRSSPRKGLASLAAVDSAVATWSGDQVQAHSMNSISRAQRQSVRGLDARQRHTACRPPKPRGKAGTSRHWFHARAAHMRALIAIVHNHDGRVWIFDARA